MDPPRPRRPGTPPAWRPPQGRARDTVEVSRAWLAMLAGGLLIALLVVAYLIGREAGRRETEAARVEPPAGVSVNREPPASTVGDDAPAGPPPEAPDSRARVIPWAPGAGASASDERVEDWTSAAPPVSAATPPIATDPQAAAVAAYFTEIETLEQQAKYWSNPQELAMSLVGQGAQGDTSGMRQLLETQRTAQQRIEAMTVPLPCQEHHRRTVAVLGQALELLEGLEGGLASGDLEGVLGLSGQARQLESETREIDALAGQIKRRYGLE